MEAGRTPEEILRDIVGIKCMERGKLCPMQSPSGRVHYNLQFWSQGANRCEYVPLVDLTAVREAVANYARFRELTEQYAAAVEQRTRQERQEESGSKKNSKRKLRRRRDKR
jgi:hypothetical protein